MAFVDTDLVRALDQPKTSPEDIVRRALDGLEAGLDEVIADELTQRGQARSVGPGRELPAAARLNAFVERHTHRSPTMTIASASAAAVAVPSLPKTSPWPVFWVASVASFLVSLDATMLYAAFGALQQGFPGASAAELSWVLNAYTVVYAAMLIPAGGLADTYGRKRVFMFGVTLFIAASAACGLAGDVSWLVAARVLQAVGAALLTPASLSIVLAAFPQQQRALTVSLWGAVAGFAAAVGPTLGSFVVQTIGWPWAFFINLPIGAVSLWRGARLLSESARASTPPPRRLGRHGAADRRRRCDRAGHRRSRVAGMDPHRSGGDRAHRRDRVDRLHRLGAPRDAIRWSI